MRYRSRGLEALSIGILFALAVRPATAESLTDALAYAYQTNPQLLAQRALLRATDESVPQALANWRPTVSFTGQTGFSNTSETFFHPCPQRLFATSRCGTAYFNTRPSS